MKMQSLATVLTVVNLVIGTFLVSQLKPVTAQGQQHVLPVLRGRALEIVDSLGRIRASITIQPTVVVDGKEYPQTALLRLIEPHGKPMIKLGATENGSGITMIDPSDKGILIHAHKDSAVIRMTNKGKTRVIQP